MKFFKIFFLVVAVLLLILVVGGVIFLKTVNVNKFKPQIVEQIRKAIGREASIGKLEWNLSFSKGVTVNVSQLSIIDDQDFDFAHFLDIDLIHLNLDVWELLTQKKIKLVSIELTRPVINLVRLPDGRMNIPVPPPSDKPADLSGLSIGQIQIKSGQISFLDRSVTPPLFVPVKNLNLNITSFAFERPVAFKADWAMYSQENNLKVGGFFKIDQLFQNIRLQDFELDVQLTSVSLGDLKKSVGFVPFVQNLQRLNGEVVLTLPEFSMSPVGLRTINARGELKHFAMETPDVPIPLEDVNGQVILTGQDLELKDWNLALASGKVYFSGKVNDYWITRSFASDLKAEDLNIAQLMKLIPGNALPQGVGLDGKLKTNLSVEGSALNLDPQEIIASLRGQGAVMIDGGVVKGFNLMQALMTRLDKLSQILGIGIKDKIVAELPEEYKKKLDISDTPIRQLQMAFQMKDEKINFNNVVLGLDEGSFTASGWVDLAQNMNLTPQVFVSPELTQVFVHSVEDLEALVGDDGRLSVPLLPYNGPVVQLNVLPDTNYLIKTLGATRVRKELKGVVTDTLGLPGDFVGAVLGGKNEKKADETADSSSPQKKTIKSKQDSTPGQMIGGVLDKILGQ